MEVVVRTEEITLKPEVLTTHVCMHSGEQTQERVNECAEAQGAQAWLWGCGKDPIK